MNYISQKDSYYMTNKITWLHISDIHFCKDNEWRDSTARSSLLKYLELIFSSKVVSKPDLIFCTGDIAFGETSSDPLPDQYNIAAKFFSKLRDVCGSESPLPADRVFLVPGNHDINRKKINSDAQRTLNEWAKDSANHVDTISKRFGSGGIEFFDTIKRLDEYGNFISTNFPHLNCENERHIYTSILKINGLNVGIFGGNSAWSCSGPEDDRNIWVAAEWQFNFSKMKIDDCDVKIGLMHHPVDWFNTTERDIATRRISTDFDFWLHGHSHNAWAIPSSHGTTIAAGAIGAHETEEFGINICEIDLNRESGSLYLHGRKASASGWTIMPIAEHAPLGVWRFELPKRLKLKISTCKDELNLQSVSDSSFDYVLQKLNADLSSSLVTFSGQPVIFVDPTISTASEVSQNAIDAKKVYINYLLNTEKSIFIKAKPQYGLTCLARHLIKQAWVNNRKFWLYLDAKILKPHNASITSESELILSPLGLNHNDVNAVVLDSWSKDIKDAEKIYNKVAEKYAGKKIICMWQDEGRLASGLPSNITDSEVETVYLWSLSRELIRKIVSSYNEEKLVGDDDLVIKRIISDLDVLNLHRTPLNCILLLRASESDFHESPVNRSEMIKRVLFLMFNTDSIPTYKSKPDVQDCEYVLGYFCEQLIKNGDYVFTRDSFLHIAQDFCKKSLIEIDTTVLFDVLYQNNILIKHGNNFYFRFSYWIFYFVAQRMHHDEEFAKYVLDDMRYAQYPEIIEFYTGGDRKRNDALAIIIRDLGGCLSSVIDKCGFPEELNPYSVATWNSSESDRVKMREVIDNGIKESSLPSEVKDRFADRGYDPAKPYNQTVADILNEHSVLSLMKLTSAAARALRNSDFSTPTLKKQLLDIIIECWEQITKIVLITSPILAKNGSAIYDNAGFALHGDFGDEFDKRLQRICCVIPHNVVSWHQDDLYSPRMGPLLFDQLNNNKLNSIGRHELMLLFIYQRPKGWEIAVKNYISTIPKNSFYLFDVHQALRHEYRYGYVSDTTLKMIEFLIKSSLIKHSTGNKDPGVKTVEKAKFTGNVLPERSV